MSKNNRYTGKENKQTQKQVEIKEQKIHKQMIRQYSRDATQRLQKKGAETVDQKTKDTETDTIKKQQQESN